MHWDLNFKTNKQLQWEGEMTWSIKHPSHKQKDPGSNFYNHGKSRQVWDMKIFGPDWPGSLWLSQFVSVRFSEWPYY